MDDTLFAGETLLNRHHKCGDNAGLCSGFGVKLFLCLCHDLFCSPTIYQLGSLCNEILQKVSEGCIAVFFELSKLSGLMGYCASSAYSGPLALH